MKTVFVVIIFVLIPSHTFARKDRVEVTVEPKCGSLWFDNYGAPSSPNTPGAHPYPNSFYVGLECTFNFFVAPGNGRAPIMAATLDSLFRQMDLSAQQRQVISAAHASFTRDYENLKKLKISSAEAKRRIDESLAKHVLSVESSLNIKVKKDPVSFSKSSM